MRTFSPGDRARPARRVAATLLAVALLAVTTYLLLDRNHAEELGGGSRAVLDLLGGQLPLALVLVVLGSAVAVAARDRRPLVRARGRS